MLNKMHQSHMGMVKTNQLARDLMFWPRMNAEIEEIVSKCEFCLKHRKNQVKEPMTIHPIPSRPWSKVGSDLFTLHKQDFLVLVDYYSNFIEVEKLDSSDSRAVINKIKANIARYGIMDTLITDNGPQYTSNEFKQFVKSYEINHETSSPYYAQSNGLAEKAVQVVKNTLDKCLKSGKDFHLAMLAIRNTPRDDVLGSPAQRLLGRRTKTHLPTSENLLKPENKNTEEIQNRMYHHRNIQKSYYDRGTKPLPEIKEGNAVRMKTKDGWQPAEYLNQHNSPNSHIIRSGSEAREYRRNRRSLLLTNESPHSIRANIPPPPLNQSVISMQDEVLDRPITPQIINSPKPPINSSYRTRSAR